ncbi:MAG: sulfur oxidation c-type cytochrome SoxX [Gemmobacter sp.]
MKSVGLAALLGAALVAGPLAAEVAPEQVEWDDLSVPVSLTGVPGDPAEGLKVFTSRAAGNCIACHSISALLDSVQWHGDVGPLLDGVGERYDEAELRGILVDAKRWWPDSMMFSFYRTSGFTRPGEGFTGEAPKEPLKPLLSAQQIEDVIAYLMTLTDY